MNKPFEILGASGQRTILAIHLYEAQKLNALLRKIKPILAVADEVWFASQYEELLEKAVASEMLSGKTSKCFRVDNQWHDWSSYLVFLRESDASNCLIICNDSIVTRRVIGGRTIRRFIEAQEIPKASIIGELDTARCSVDLGGWSSACWISTYLFAIQGVKVDVQQLLMSVENDVKGSLSDSDHFFNCYLGARRADVVIGDVNRRAKLGAMFFERRLTRLITESGVPIVNFCAGSKVRKVERLLERLLDA